MFRSGKNKDIHISLLCSYLQTIKAGKNTNGYYVPCLLYFILSREESAETVYLLLVFPFLFLVSFILWFLYSLHNKAVNSGMK